MLSIKQNRVNSLLVFIQVVGGGGGEESEERCPVYIKHRHCTTIYDSPECIYDLDEAKMSAICSFIAHFFTYLPIIIVTLFYTIRGRMLYLVRLLPTCDLVFGLWHSWIQWVSRRNALKVYQPFSKERFPY